MGRIKTKQIKRVTQEINEKYNSEFSQDFNANKKQLPAVADIKSKKLRNQIAGYLSRIAKNQKE